MKQNIFIRTEKLCHENNMALSGLSVSEESIILISITFILRPAEAMLFVMAKAFLFL